MECSATSRLDRFRERLARERLDWFVVTHPPNVLYLVGFTGSAGALLVSPRQAVLFTDGRYRLQARQEVSEAEVEITPEAPAEAAARRLRRRSRGRMGFEACQLPFSLYDRVRRAIPSGVKLAASLGIVEKLRARKDPGEIAKISKAVDLAAAVFEGALDLVRPGAVEQDLAAEIEYRMKRRGALGPSFETIVASGPRGALPHARTSAKRLKKNEFVVFDLGAILAHYASDMTRTVYLGRPSREARRLYEAVRAAQQKAIDTVRAGVESGRVDAAARGELRRAGLARYFVHGTGHGVGLEIHEDPRIGRTRSTRLEAGNVVTIEPGIYLPGRLGIRIEDIVVVGSDRAQVLTPTTKELITL